MLRQMPASAMSLQMVLTSAWIFVRFLSEKMVRPSSLSFTPLVCFMPGKCGAPSFCRWFSELMVGIHTIFAPILMAVSTAKGLNPPTGLLSAMPP